jgi:hypothetical protein
MAIVDQECVSYDVAVTVPEAAAGDKAKLTLSFADWKEGGVLPGTAHVAIVDPKPGGKK